MSRHSDLRRETSMWPVLLFVDSRPFTQTPTRPVYPSLTLVEQPSNLGQTPNVVGDARRHRGRPWVGVPQTLVGSGEVVELKVQRDGRRVVLDLP